MRGRLLPLYGFIAALAAALPAAPAAADPWKDESGHGRREREYRGDRGRDEHRGERWRGRGEHRGDHDRRGGYDRRWDWDGRGH
jgi:hypothetical protein